MNRFPSIKSLPQEDQIRLKRARAKHKELTDQLVRNCRDKSAGFFGPGSMTWKFYSEPCIILGSSRALLLQIAHPAIAGGVKSHSNFRQHFAGRAHRTFTSMIRIWFGDTKTAINSAKRLYNIHSMIRGTAVWETEDDQILKPFNAADPDLLFWVLATLIDTTLTMLELFKGPMPRQDKELFYQESKITARLMGIPPEHYPDTLESFYKTYLDIMHSGTLYIGAAGTEIKDAVFKVPYPARWFARLMAAGLLTDSLHAAFDLRFEKMQSRLFQVILAVLKFHYRLLPDKLWCPPHVHQANYRIAKAQGRKPSFMEKLHTWLGENLDFYFVSTRLYPRKLTKG